MVTRPGRFEGQEDAMSVHSSVATFGRFILRMEYSFEATGTGSS